MRPLSRRNFLRATAIVAGSAALLGIYKQGQPPTEAWVRERLWGDELLAYAVWDGSPRAVVQFSPGRVSYDLMIPGDWFWPNWPPAPQWQLAGLGYAISSSNEPATVGYAPCVGIAGEQCGQAPELFGQINEPNIVAMEVRIDDAWRRFAVAAPGFAVRLDGASSVPTGFRWLDAEGSIVWETTMPSPKSAGRRARRRRERRKATPAPTGSAESPAPAS